MSEAMPDRTLERWASAVGLLVCLAVGIPVVLEQLAGNDPVAGPAWVWWVAYLGYLTLLVGIERPVRVLPDVPPSILVIGLAVLGSTVTLLSQETGFTAVLLVFTAAIAGYVVQPRAVVALVVLQSVVVGVAVASEGAPLRWVLLATGFYVGLQVLVVVAARVEQRSTRVREELADANLKLRAANALLEGTARTNERLRIARELHDAVGHQLTVLSLELEVASHLAGPPAGDHVRRARAVAGELLSDVRSVVSELRQRPPELHGALAAVVADVRDPKVHLDVDEVVALDEERVATLVRCVQEVVTNTLRHAGAANLWIEVVADDGGGVRLLARDDGRGTAVLHVGNGLTGLTERVEALGGEVRFAGRAGFQVEARLPPAPAAEGPSAAPPAAPPGAAVGAP